MKRRVNVGAVVGLVLLAAGGAAALLILRSGDEAYRATVVLEDAGGLRAGANVRLGGAPAGKVVEIDLDEKDRAVAEIEIDEGGAPLGAGARALVQADGFFGERYIELTGGDAERPQPSGTVIPTSRSAVSVRLDDVVDALDLDTRGALQVFIREQGAALVGRGRNLAAVLSSLPPGLDRTGELIDQFAADNQALGELVERSDRVVASVAARRDQLGRMIAGLGSTLDVLASRRLQLGDTVRSAPETLRQAQATLASLEGAAQDLGPAARGLRQMAPSLTTTLKELPALAEAAVPALDELTMVSPDLERLATEGTPVVHELAPLTSELTGYTTRALGPLTAMLADQGAADLFGVMEGWARATQPRDAASQVFRFGINGLVDPLVLPGINAPASEDGGNGGGSGGGGEGEDTTLTDGPAPDESPPESSNPGNPLDLENLDDLPGDVVEQLDGALGGDGNGNGGLGATGQATQDLLDFLLGP